MFALFYYRFHIFLTLSQDFNTAVISFRLANEEYFPFHKEMFVLFFSF